MSPLHTKGPGVPRKAPAPQHLPRPPHPSGSAHTAAILHMRVDNKKRYLYLNIHGTDFRYLHRPTYKYKNNSAPRPQVLGEPRGQFG